MISDSLLGIATFCKRLNLFERDLFSNYDRYENRLIFVKLIYLFQSITGVSLGYSYFWHKAGPYSKEVWAIGYLFQKEGKDYSKEIEQKDIKFTDSSINKKIDLFYEKIKTLLNDSEKMELAASLEYIRSEGISDKNLMEELFKKKPKFQTKQQLVASMIDNLNTIRKDFN